MREYKKKIAVDDEVEKEKVVGKKRPATAQAKPASKSKSADKGVNKKSAKKAPHKKPANKSVPKIVVPIVPNKEENK